MYDAHAFSKHQYQAIHPKLLTTNLSTANLSATNIIFYLR